jgi:hypothetical protein
MQAILYKEGFIMTEKEQYELMGKVTSEFQEKSRELQMLKIKAEEIGKNLVKIGTQLEKNPEFLIFSGETANPQFVRIAPFKKDILTSFNTIIDLCNQIRNTIVDLQRLEEKKKALGI